ncbi:MAG: hypothetical protein ACFCU5_19510 [Pleurocapsa sp.]
MKTNTLHFSSCFKFVIMAIALLLMVADAPVKAQKITEIDNFILNGLFTPTAAQRFFETGRDNLVRETRILEDSERYFNENILQIDPEVMQQMKRNRSSLDLWIINPPQQLYLDTK